MFLENTLELGHSSLGFGIPWIRIPKLYVIFESLDPPGQSVLVALEKNEEHFTKYISTLTGKREESFDLKDSLAVRK